MRVLWCCANLGEVVRGRLGFGEVFEVCSSFMCFFICMPVFWRNCMCVCVRECICNFFSSICQDISVVRNG